MAAPKKKDVSAKSKRKPTAVTVRGSKEWGDWVSRGAKFCLTDTSKLIDIAVTKYLREQGFTEVRPDRSGDDS